METLNEDTEAVVGAGKVARRTSRARTPIEIRSLARSHTETAIRVLVDIMRSADATPAARASAANMILDRGWGKAAQPLENSDEGVLQLIQKIERIIVHPESSGDIIRATAREPG